MLRITSRFIVATAIFGSVLSIVAQTASAVPVETMYADAVSKEVAVHTALAAPQALPTVLKAVRTVVGDYEAIVRAYPSSGYGDDALWRAGLVSIDAFKKFDDTHDRDAAVRLLRALVAQYPTSKLAKNVPAVLASLGEPGGGSPVQVVSRQSSVISQSSVVSRQSSVVSPTAVVNEQAPVVGAQPGAAVRTITSVKRTVLPDAVRVTIEIEAEVPFHEERIEGPERIFIDLPSTKSVPSLVDKTLRFDGDSDPVHQIRVGRHTEDSTRIVLDANGVASYSVYPLYNPYRLVIDCVRAPAAPRTPAQPTMATPARPATVATAVKPAPRPSPPAVKARRLVPDLVFALAGGTPANAAAFERALEPEAIDASLAGVAPLSPIAAAATVPIASAAPAAPSALPAPDKNLAGGFSIARQLGLGVSRIVIDPGHGGHDPGASKNGVGEADLVLDVALRLEKLLQKVPDVEVILTRRTDDFVPLQERTAIANREHADLFLSIHANASSNVLTRGVETYYLNFASNMDTASVAARENAASGQAMGAAPDIVKSIALNNKLDESRDFATDVQRAMIEKLRATNKTVKDLGVKQAPFMVLIGAAMPSVLAEVSFVTNEPEAKLLKGSAYRQKIAEALFAAVRKYQTSLKSVGTVAREP
jgi:N-acetylmuramoyl-L-alanine amidase